MGFTAGGGEVEKTAEQKAIERRQRMALDKETAQSERRLKAVARGALGKASLLGTPEEEDAFAGRKPKTIFDVAGGERWKMIERRLENASSSTPILIGYRAGYSSGLGSESVFIGSTAGFNNTGSGRYNTGIGGRALNNNSDGDYNTALGWNAFWSGSSYINSTCIGYNTQASASHQIRLGNDAVTSIGGYANWTNVSDGRFKTNVQETVEGLDFIMKLRPVTYNLDMDAIAKFNNTPDSLRLFEAEALKAAELQSGFIAQEVEEAAQAVGYDFHGVEKPQNEESHYGLRYAEFVVPMVKAMQEQQQMIEEQRALIEALQQEVNQLKRNDNK